MNIKELLTITYAAFNARDIEAVLGVLHADVDWENGMEGGRVFGHEEVRKYWIRQWSMIDPTVTPERIVKEEDGRIAVLVHQVVRDLEGNLLSDGKVEHVYLIEGDLVKRMEIRELK
jgi:ketosteroid isomerase-like protein